MFSARPPSVYSSSLPGFGVIFGLYRGTGFWLGVVILVRRHNVQYT